MSLVHLSSATIKLITSSQVITSVSSVVKELVENAIDAGATNIDVKLDNNGFRRVEVKDDGFGINKSDMVHVCMPSYTSKIKDFSDLESLESYGFRGEALSALCQVADVTITTRTSSDELATEYSIGKNGEVVSSKLSHHGVGTQIVAINLFQNLPVRKQYLNSGRRGTDELKRVESIVKSLAVIHEGLRVTFSHNKCRLWQKTAVSSLKQSLMQAVGHAIASKLEELSLNNAEMSIKMLIPKKDCTDVVAQSNPETVMVFINKRPVRHKKVEKLLMKYINTCFEGQIPPQKYPHCLISVDIDPSGLDVNLEPNKSKVMFKEEGNVLLQVEKLLQTYYEPGIDSAAKILVKNTLSSNKRQISDPDDFNQNGQSCNGVTMKTLSSKDFKVESSHSVITDDSRAGGGVDIGIENSYNFREDSTCNAENNFSNKYHPEILPPETANGAHEADIGMATTVPNNKQSVTEPMSVNDGSRTYSENANGNKSFETINSPTLEHIRSKNDNEWFNDNFSDFSFDCAVDSDRTFMNDGCNNPVTNNGSSNNLGKEESINNNILNSNNNNGPKMTLRENMVPAARTDCLWQNAAHNIPEPHPSEVLACTKPQNVTDKLENDISKQFPVVSDQEWEMIDNTSEKWSLQPNNKLKEPNDPGTGVSIATEKWSMGQLRTGNGQKLQGSCVLLPTTSPLLPTTSRLLPTTSPLLPITSPLLSNASPQASMDQSVSSQMGQREHSAFTKFSREIRPLILQENPGIAFTKVAGMMVRRWRCLKAEEKAEYEFMAREANEDRKRKQSNDDAKEPDPKKVKEKVEHFQKLLNKSVEASPHRAKQTEHKRKAIARPVRKEQQVDFSFNVLTARLQSEACEEPPGFALIGRLTPSNTWLYRQGGEIGVVRHWGLQETVLNDKLLKDHSVPLTQLDSPVDINERTIGPDMWRLLLSLEKSYSGLSNSITISNQFVLRNGFKIEVVEGESGVSCLLTGVPSVARFYGLPELIDTLKLMQSLGAACTLDQCRPTKIRHYIEAEAVRMTRESPALDREALDDLLKYWHLTFNEDRPYSCLHGRPIFSAIHNLKAKQSSKDAW